MEERIEILMVDDEAFNFEIMSTSLPKRFHVEYVSSGESCLAKAMLKRPAIILLDVLMPGLDGYDTCRLLKNTPETKHIPIIMVSGLESQEEKHLAFEAGCDAYMVKPYAISELIENIDKFVSPIRHVR